MYDQITESRPYHLVTKATQYTWEHENLGPQRLRVPAFRNPLF